MGGINELNSQYVEAKKILEKMQTYEELVLNEQNSPVEFKTKIIKSLNHVDELTKELDCSDCPQIMDTLGLGNTYRKCINAILEYRSALLTYTRTGKGDLTQAKNALSFAQKEYDSQRTDFEKKYHCVIDSLETLNNAISVCIGNAIVPVKREVEEIIGLARQNMDNKFTVDLSEPGRSQKKVINLPDKMVLARQLYKKTAMTLLKDIGMEGTYQVIRADLKDKGNTIVSTQYANLNDDRIDRFVLAYIIRFIESFPLGAVNVHIFGQNTSFLYKRLSNSFQSEDAGELTRKTVQLHTDINELASFRDVICEDIFRKTSVDNPDLYAIYEHDKSDPFNLIVLRDGLVDGSGYAPANMLDVINSLSKQGDMGHKCGLRFLIIDSSPSFEKNLTDNIKYLISQIYNNCEHVFLYKDKRFYFNDKEIETLNISGDIETFIQNESRSIAGAMNSKTQSYIAITDVASKEIEETPGCIMYIPVGMSGESKVELPFSCKDENGTVAGQCIGYMVIGQSGSGKSSFFHSLVLNGCIKYSPQNLQFWLLDFKNGGASSKYRDSGLPHIKMIAENNKIDDALCLFQMVLEEMERRSKLFNNVFADNIVDYNRIADANGAEHLPRIIIAIDEVQEIFRDDNSSEIQNLISSISTRMRSAGMHFVMVAQNLSEGKSYMLKDAFLPSATGRICFRVAPEIPRDSGFGEDFSARKQEIVDLKTGEAYVGYGRDTIRKVRMAYTTTQEMNEKYFGGIRKRYPGYERIKPMVIGSKQRVSIISRLQGRQTAYFDEIGNVRSYNGMYYAVVGEDAYRMSPLRIQFSQHENSSVLLLGNDKLISSSLSTSIALSLYRQGMKVHLFNGDRTKVQTGGEAVAHSFMYICQNASFTDGRFINHKMNELKDVLGDLYAEYLKRQSAFQEADDVDPIFDPMFLIVNDLFAIECFINNERIEGGTSGSPKEIDMSRPLSFDDNDLFSRPAGNKDRFNEPIQNIMSTLLKSGWRYNIFIVLAIKGDSSIWRSLNPAKDVNNILLFNQNDYADQFDRSYYLKEMLKNITIESGSETMAVYVNRKSFSKVRPIIYDVSDQQERRALEVLEEVKRDEKAV